VTAEREQLRRRFADGERWFHDSPLYQALSRAVSEDDALLQLAAQARAGQQPTNLLMGATHLVVLSEPDHRFARFFPTVAGRDAEPPDRAGAEFPAFCADHREALTELLRTRLVQTNEPARATALRLALYEVGRRIDGPAHLLEIGPSAGIQLCFDRWGVRTGGHSFGPPDPPLTIATEWRGPTQPPDLDAIAQISGRLGVDLHPVDATHPGERQWLQALVWPEHLDRFEQLRLALQAVAADPPEILRGDAVDALPGLDAPARRPAADRVPLPGPHPRPGRPSRRLRCGDRRARGPATAAARLAGAPRRRARGAGTARLGGRRRRPRAGARSRPLDRPLLRLRRALG
jgi:hypothetical protein